MTRNMLPHFPRPKTPVHYSQVHTNKKFFCTWAMRGFAMVFIGVKTCFFHIMQDVVEKIRAMCFVRAHCSIMLQEKHEDKTLHHGHYNVIVFGHTILSAEDIVTQSHCIKKMYSVSVFSPIDIDIVQYNDLVVTTSLFQIPSPLLEKNPVLIHLMAMIDPLNRYPQQDHHPFSKKTWGSIAASQHNKTDYPFTKSFVINPSLVGIVNITPDSFSDGNLYMKTDHAIQHIVTLAQCGAAIIDIGAQSTRPGSGHLVDPDTEYARLEPVFAELRHLKMLPPISLDSCCPDVIIKILDRYSVSWINSPVDYLDEATLQTIASYDCYLLAMHAITIPASSLHIDDEKDTMATINIWCKKVVDRLIRCGFTTKKIILDPGIGFGKSPYQNIDVIQCIDCLHTWGCKILVGHSRKSFMATFSPYQASERDFETISLSIFLKDRVDFLRVHDVAAHHRGLVAHHLVSSPHYNRRSPIR